MQYRKDKKGEGISLLGSGCMRFQKKGISIDINKADTDASQCIGCGKCEEHCPQGIAIR